MDARAKGSALHLFHFVQVQKDVRTVTLFPSDDDDDDKDRQL